MNALISMGFESSTSRTAVSTGRSRSSAFLRNIRPAPRPRPFIDGVYEASVEPIWPRLTVRYLATQ